MKLPAANLKHLTMKAAYRLCCLSAGNHVVTTTFIVAITIIVFVVGTRPQHEAAVLAPLHAGHLFLLAAAAAILLYLKRRRAPAAVYLVEYSCFRGAPVFRAPSATFIEHTRLTHRADEDAVTFMARVLERLGMGEETSVPPGLQYIPPDQTLRSAREEAELVIFSTVDALFAKLKAPSPRDVDVVIVCCSLCAPTPSFSDMVVNRYAMRGDVRSVNLSGTGCGGGLVAVDLAARLLRSMPRGAHALVVTTEILASNYYVGSDRSMLVANCTFRMSGAAALMSTSETGGRFRLGVVERTCGAARDDAYRAVFQMEDGKGRLGTRVDPGFVSVAGDMLKSNIKAFAPRVLPVSELLRVALSTVVARKNSIYRPNFRRAFEHFCVHAAALGVVDTVQRGLGLSDLDVEAARMTLHRFGYTSSSSVLYELAYLEAKGRMKKGDRVWMIAFGAGFDCNSVSWECVQPASHADGSWADCIHCYPVRHLPGMGR